MFLLFSSDHSIRYKRNALDMLCYPEGHSFTLRYSSEHVSSKVSKFKRQDGILLEWRKELGTKGVTVYAEKPTHPEIQPFNFCPLREVEVVRIRVLGSVYYVDVRLGKFINFAASATDSKVHLKNWQCALEVLDRSPRPPEADVNESYFFQWQKEPLISHSTNEQDPFKAWESTVELLSQFKSMQQAVFYHVIGFYTPTGLKWCNRLVRSEKRILIEDDGWVTKFPLPMGETVTLRLLFFRSRKSDKPVITTTLNVSVDESAFAGISAKTIEVLNRYNEERIELACRRVWDNTLAPLTIECVKKDNKPENGEEKDNKEVMVPRPFLLSYVKAPRILLWRAVLMLFFGSALLVIPPDILLWQKQGISSGFLHDILSTHSTQILELLIIGCKGAGSALIAWAFFLTLRRFPLPR